MQIELEKVPSEKMEKIVVDKETLRLLEAITGLSGSCYDWWELSQGIKDIACALSLLEIRLR